MRFLLDNDVDVAVGHVLRQGGHECWAAAELGLARADDDTIAVYADDRNAVVITHDREFTARRMQRTHGRHVRLTCQEPDAVDVVAEHMATMIGHLDTGDHIVLLVSTSGVVRHAGRWS